MKPLTLTLAFLTFLCTCGRAQKLYPNLNYETTNVAFIKGETGFIIDSIAISTSLDTVPYGFPFPGDTLSLDITIFSPVDYLTVETFGGSHSFGLQKCWVDAPFADVYLSIQAGRGKIDYVGVSQADSWYQAKAVEVTRIANPELRKMSLRYAINNQYDNLMASKFLATYLDLPNLTREDIKLLKTEWSYLLSEDILRHPWLLPIRRKMKLAGSNLPGALDRFPLLTTEGKTIQLKRPSTDYYVLNVYRYSDPVSQRDHQMIREVYRNDSLFQYAPMLSIDTEESRALWRLYVRDGDFDWPHFRSDPADRKSLVSKMNYGNGPYYVLVNKRNRIEGVYKDLEKLALAIMFRQRRNTSKP